MAKNINYRSGAALVRRVSMLGGALALVGALGCVTSSRPQQGVETQPLWGTARAKVPPAVAASPSDAWRSGTLGAVLVPVGSERAPYDVADLARVLVGTQDVAGPVSSGWPAVIRTQSAGRADLEVRVLPWLILPKKGDRSVERVAHLVLDLADRTVDLARFADSTGRIRAMVVPVQAGVAGIKKGRLATVRASYTARMATQKTVVEKLILVGMPANAHELSSADGMASGVGMAVLAEVLGMRQPLVRNAITGTPEIAPAGQEELGWTRTVSIAESGPLVIPTTVSAVAAESVTPPSVYRLPVPGTRPSEFVTLRSYDKGRLQLSHYQASNGGGAATLLSQMVVSQSEDITYYPLMPYTAVEDDDSVHAAGPHMYIAWEASNAVVQVNLSSLGVEREQKQRLEGQIYP